jgi:preprotein translocase subunit SecE
VTAAEAEPVVYGSSIGPGVLLPADTDRALARSRKRAKVAERRRRGTNPADDRREEELSAEDAAIEEEFADELDSLDTADDVDDDTDDDDLDDDATASKNGRSKDKTKDAKSKDLKVKDGRKVKVKEGGSNNIFARLINFIREVVAELRKVIWPTRKELTTYTVVVVVFVIIMLAIVGGLDYGFAKLVLWSFGNGSADQ